MMFLSVTLLGTVFFSGCPGDYRVHAFSSMVYTGSVFCNSVWSAEFLHHIGPFAFPSPCSSHLIRKVMCSEDPIRPCSVSAVHQPSAPGRSPFLSLSLPFSVSPGFLLASFPSSLKSFHWPAPGNPPPLP